MSYKNELSSNNADLQYILNAVHNLTTGDEMEKMLIERTYSTVYESDNIEKIAKYAFYGASLRAASFPNCISVDDNAFFNCIDLSSVYLPECTYLGYSAFYQCGIESIDLPKLTSISGTSAFYACDSLTTVNFPNITSLPFETFVACRSLASVSIPKLTSVPQGCFKRCYALSSIEFPECSQIGSSAFYSCSALKTAIFPKCTDIYQFAFANCSLSSISFPKLKNINTRAFCFNNNLTNVELPECETIGSGGFWSCNSLVNVSIPKCSIISDMAFSSCSSLQNIYAPECSYIDDYAFSGCTSLSAANFPSVTTIGNAAFSGCYNLTEISFPVATMISNWAFKDCSALTSVDFPSATFISNTAFLNCSMLTTASFPSATNIGTYAFSQCYNLKSLYLTGSTICNLAGSNAFSYTPIGGYSTSAGTYGSIYVPTYLLSNYKSAANWSYFSSRFVGIIVPYVGSTKSKILLFNSSDSASIPLYYMDNAPSVTVISSDESVVSVSNIATTSENITFNIASHDIEGSAEITVTAIYDNKTYVETFKVSVYEVMPTTTYSVEDLATTYGFVLNDSGYYESNNKGVNSSFALCKVNIFADGDYTMYVDCINSGENSYDYGLLSNLDATLTSSATADSSNVKQSFKGKSSQDIQTVSYDVSYGEHYIYVKYIKDSSSNSGNDSLQFKIRFE